MRIGGVQLRAALTLAIIICAATIDHSLPLPQTFSFPSLSPARTELLAQFRDILPLPPPLPLRVL